MPESFLSWDPAQVSSYLQAHVDQDITTAFIENNIDGSLLPFLTTGHLRELGIENLALRLRTKRAINDLLASQFAENVPSGPNDPHFRLTAININSNYVSMEALTLCSLLLRDINKSIESKPDPEAVDMKILNENFSKLKTDLNLVIRLIKDYKPLPTPTLDPGVAVALPTNSTYTSNTRLTSESDTNTLTGTATTDPSSAQASTTAPSPLNQHQATSIPKLALNASTQRPLSTFSPSKRFSSESIISMGVGKVADVKNSTSNRYLAKPRLVEAKHSPAIYDGEVSDNPGFRLLLVQPVTGIAPPPTLKNSASSSLLVTSRTITEIPSLLGTQPLKQLKASSDDTCLKVLQQAMRRHYIPREKWSKYVLVICYGDQERILKLTEKPVLVFKELQGHEKNPTIMLRELAPSASLTIDEYEDSRIGNDIPGGTL